MKQHLTQRIAKDRSPHPPPLPRRPTQRPQRRYPRLGGGAEFKHKPDLHRRLQHGLYERDVEGWDTSECGWGFVDGGTDRACFGQCGEGDGEWDGGVRRWGRVCSISAARKRDVFRSASGRRSR